MLSESPRCNDMVADLHFPRFFGTAIQCEIARRFSQRSMQKYQYFEWGLTLNLDGFKIIIFQYIICEPFRSWKEGLAKLDVNLWEIRRKFKCRRSMSYPPPPPFSMVLVGHGFINWVISSFRTVFMNKNSGRITALSWYLIVVFRSHNNKNDHLTRPC